MTTPRIDFSIHNKHKKVVEIIDSWKQKGSYSDKICQAIIKLHEEEEKGSKITQFTGEQSKLPLLPPIYQALKPEDLEGVTYDEKRNLAMALTESLAVIRKDIIAIQSLK